MAVPIADGMIEIDTKLGGWEHVTSGYLIHGESPVLIETGSQSSSATLLNELNNLGVAANDLAAIVVTHIHLDHAGGVGDLAEAFPKAKIFVHPAGARHLVDPSRLIASAQMVYGPLLDELYGRMTPSPSERVLAVEEGQVIEVTKGTELRVMLTPGHAKHHISLWHEQSGTMFCGDAVGVKLPEVGILWPATPPPDFDLHLASVSLKRMASMKPSHLAFAHYGRFPRAVEILKEADELLHAWCNVAEKAAEEHLDIEEELAKTFAPSLEDTDREAKERLLTLSGIHANATGIARWLSKREQAESQSGGSGI
jgi:glyoxylase-like metal-dependent hydrolase (beta-lactamase superfamily II)